MPQLRMIDSHVHLWPKEMSNEEGHSWMTPGMPLAKEHLLSAYCTAAEQNGDNESGTIVEGVIYVETDVKYGQPSDQLSKWAKGPLDEIRFLRAIVEGHYGERDSELLLGIVAWAPMDQPPCVLEEWLRVAEENAGPKTWRRIKGFRFLLQAILDQRKFEALVLGEDFLENLAILGRRGFTFDVGVDEHSGGIWQLEAISYAMEIAHRDTSEAEKVVFVLNHLCKPNFANRGQDFRRWCTAIERMSRLSKTYMKLSGAFSELPDGLATIGDIVMLLEPWTNHTFQAFGPSRVMVGSDWPVCNLKGPRQEESWVSWREVVEGVLAGMDRRFSAGDKERVWRGTVLEAYGVSLNSTG